MAKFRSNQDLNKFIRSVCIAAAIQSNNGEPADQVGEAIEERIAGRHELYLMDTISPELDPNSLVFDKEAYKAAAIQAAKDMNAAISKNNAAVNTRNLSKLTEEEIIAALMELREEIFNPLRFFAQAGQAAAQAIGKALKEAGGTLDKRSDTFIEKVAELEPYLIIELENAAAVNPDFENYSIWDIYEIGFDENGEPTESIFSNIIAQAKYRKVSYMDTEGTTEALIALDDYSKKPIEPIEPTAQPRGTYRTKSKAQEAGIITPQITALAIPTLPKYENSMSFLQNQTAHLEIFKSTDNLRFKDGKIYFSTMKSISEIELQNMKTKEGIQDIDLPTLRIFYSIILKAFEKNNYTNANEIITVYVPDLAECFGLSPKQNKKEIERVIEKSQSFHNIVGILYEQRNGKPAPSIYPVLNFEGYNDKNNTISFSSPYMNYLIKKIYSAAIRKDKKGNPKLTSSGEPKLKASHSFLIKNSIAKEKNKAAVENVCIIVRVIEAAGNNTVNIKAKTIIERNTQFAERLKTYSKPSTLLARTFKKTWELLDTQTYLKDYYKEIKLPDPKNPANIPTVKNMNTLVFKITHNGKK